MRISAHSRLRTKRWGVASGGRLPSGHTGATAPCRAPRRSAAHARQRMALRGRARPAARGSGAAAASARVRLVDDAYALQEFVAGHHAGAPDGHVGDARQQPARQPARALLPQQRRGHAPERHRLRARLALGRLQPAPGQPCSSEFALADRVQPLSSTPAVPSNISCSAACARISSSKAAPCPESDSLRSGVACSDSAPALHAFHGAQTLCTADALTVLHTGPGPNVHVLLECPAQTSALQIILILVSPKPTNEAPHPWTCGRAAGRRAPAGASL